MHSGICFRTAPLLMAFTISSDSRGETFVFATRSPESRLPGLHRVQCRKHPKASKSCTNILPCIMAFNIATLSCVRHESGPSLTLQVCWMKTNPAVAANESKLCLSRCESVWMDRRLLASHILRCKLVMLHLCDLYRANHNSTNQSIANHMSAQVKIVLKAILQTFHDTCIPTIMHIHAYNINFNHEFARSSRSKILLFVVGSSTYRTALCISKSLRYGSLLSHQALKLIKVEALEAAGSVLHLTQKSNPKGSVKVILNLYYT